MSAELRTEPSESWCLGHLLLRPSVVLFALIWWLNDLIGKPYFHCWLTGKLSDAASLVVFPLFGFTLLDGAGWWLGGNAWLQREAHRRLLLQLVIVATGLLFISIKVSPALGNQYRVGWQLFYHCVNLTLPSSLRVHAVHAVDATDLFTLPFLLLAQRWGLTDLLRQAPRADASGYTG